jgi:hypothetical protein
MWPSDEEPSKHPRVARHVHQIRALTLLSAVGINALTMGTYKNEDFFPLVLYYMSSVVRRVASFGTPMKASQASSGESGYVEVSRDPDNGNGVSHGERGPGICLEWGIRIPGICVSTIWLLWL